MPVLTVKRIEYLSPIDSVNKNVNIYVCCYCNRKFGQKPRKNEHEKICSRNRMMNKMILRDRYCCDNCGSSFKRESTLYAHETSNCCKTYECKKVEKDVTQKRPLPDVTRIEHPTPLKEVNDNIKIHLCRFCNRKFGQKAGKNKHERFCTCNPMIDESILRDRFCCDKCGSSFEHKRTLYAHEKSNCCNAPKCKEVKKDIINKRPLLKVKRIQHPTPLKEVNDNINIHLCRFCNRKFNVKARKDQHEKFCTRNPMIDESILRDRFCCDNCGSSFKQKQALDAHEKSNCCNTPKCKKDEKEITNEMPVLKIQRIEHPTPLKEDSDNKNIHLCRFCNRKFEDKSRKNNHEKICTRYRKMKKRMLRGRFCCNNCDCSYKHKCNLYTHKKFYCDNKPEKCKICNKIFANPRILKYHIEKHH
ncbi:zinc finger protein 85-like [Leptopilina heterotoma]|uniref:zinc finger protein 85-like n=1 Tax=Leptopilina heterotoma TaxID=63436 RepID=UPI001CA85339|nr:zinc finger protein 85-like [Leptopilina heterotoma]